MNFNRYAMSRAALGLCSALLFLSVPQARAQQSGPETNSSMISFSSREELRASDAAGILASRLQLRPGVDELRSAYIENPGDGLQVQRFHQYFQGLRVAHGSYSLTSKNGYASFAFGKFYQVPATFSIVPAIDEKTALANALKEIGASKYAWDSDPAQYPKGELQLCEDFRKEQMDGEVHLAWVFDVFAEAPLSGNKMYIDAQTGKLLLADAIIKHTAASGPSLYSGTVSFQAALVGGSYILYDSTRGGGIATYDLKGSTNTGSPVNVTSATTVFAQDPAIDAQWGATQVYDYWKNTHNRLSWNGTNGILRSYVHFDKNYNNAMWNGSAMVYGDGSGVGSGGLSPLTSLDVCGHEIGHGVCQSTANLVYSRESGAMNEGFSDIWGAVIEHYGDPHEVDAMPKDMWLIGEELGSAPFRSMRQPKLYSQPNTYQGVNWWNANAATCNSTLNDNCGVHYNSGVLNYWFYLLTDGGSGTNDLNDYYKVAGVGVLNAAKIAYATELILNSSANYASCRVASISAATTIFGACSKEVEAVTRAWFAVGVGADYNSACTPQIAFESGVNTSISENVGINDCKPSKLINVPVVLRGTSALSGDSATVTATVVGGNAVSGVDYQLSVPSATFQVAGATAANIGIIVYDNGYVNASKYIDLKLTLNARGSNASLAIVGDSTRVVIAENESTPDLGGSEMHQVLTPNGSSTTASPFYGASLGARNQYIYRPFELAAAGVRPNVPITSLEFNVNGLFSSQPYDGYTVKIGNSSTGTLNTGWITSGLNQVYNGSFSPSFGWNQLPFSTPFVWNGTDNVVIEICFANNTVGASSNDRVSVGNGPQFLSAFASSNSAAGCGLAFNNANLQGQRPLLRLNQDVTGAAIETAVNATRTWDVPAGKEAYFLSAGAEKLMVGISSGTDSLGCVTASVSAAGDGLDYVKFANGLHRTRKEYTISRSAQEPKTFGGTLYFTDDELGGMDIYKARIVYTSVANDWDIRSSNSRIIPVDELVVGVGYKGFKGNLSAFGRYFLIDDVLTLNVGTSAAPENNLWTGANPFTSYPVLHWNLSRSEQVSIRLLDVTGKLVYSNDTRLDAGTNKLELRASAALAPGTYVLQVVRPDAVFTSQLIKQ